METREERLERRRRERAEQVAYKLEQEIAVWDPAGIPNVTADPFKTLFVARIVSTLASNKIDPYHYILASVLFRVYNLDVLNAFRTTIRPSPNSGGNSKYMGQ